MKKYKMSSLFKWIGITIAAGILWEYIAKPIIGIIGGYRGTITGAIVDYYFVNCSRIDINFIMFQFCFCVFWVAIVKFINSTILFNDNEYIVNEEKKPKKPLLNDKVVNIIVVSYIVLVTIGVVFFALAPGINNLAFDKAIIEITPYVEHTDIDRLKSDWVRMKTYDDYKKIDNFINDVIEKNDLNDKKEDTPNE